MNKSNYFYIKCIIWKKVWYQICFIGLDYYKRPNVVACVKVHVSGFLGGVRRTEELFARGGGFYGFFWNKKLPVGI